MKQENKVFKLKGKVQHYAWGGHSYLPRLLSIPNPEDKPFAEYWMGAHDNAPSELVVESGSTTLTVPLNGYIKEWPESTLGSYVAGRFGRLPYLLKILDVKDMLSIQVHPTKKNAELEFAAEDKKGVALNAPNRNYKDDNHKPELMLALSEFWLLHGFKPADVLEKTLLAVPELAFLAPVFKKDGYQGLYKTVMELPQSTVNEGLQPLLDRIVPAYRDGRLSRNEEHFWAARAAETYNEPGRIDRGIFSIYLFNLLNLHPGEAIFQDAGLPHAYLEGQNVEIMANSDNVLRGGLTPKHVDVPELLKHIKFEATHARVIAENNTLGTIAAYKTPAPDFELSRIGLLQAGQVEILARSIEIFIVLEGEVLVEENSGNTFHRKTGEVFLAFDQAKLKLRASQNIVVYRASVPVPA
ncbi:MAG TPA: mannose-6-phosphate isomerase, class I [Puia sp.]|nr:mannose-6-phosphate isomerase, class I [Puia sp.]